MKVAVITDTNSGITREEGEKLGIYLLPMPFMIDEVPYDEGVSLTHAEFYEKQEGGADILTSQPSPESVTKLWDELLSEYDEIVHIPMSSGLSGSCQTAMMLAEDYDGKVQVVNNQRISVTQLRSAQDAAELAAAGKSAVEIREYLEKTKMDSTIYITVDTLKYLKKGGRITPAAAALGTLLRIKPVLQIQGERLDAFSKARTMKQAKSTMLSALQSDLENRFHDPEAEHMWLYVVHSKNEEAAAEFQAELQTAYPKAVVGMGNLSLSVACHTGPGALAVAAVKKME